MNDRREIDLPDDGTGIDEPHDVLAAEEFAMPTRSAGDVPPDPTGIQEPHDVLAAEEFAMPGADRIDHDADGLVDPRSLIPGALLILLALLLLRRRRRSG